MLALLERNEHPMKYLNTLDVEEVREYITERLCIHKKGQNRMIIAVNDPTTDYYKYARKKHRGSMSTATS